MANLIRSFPDDVQIQSLLSSYLLVEICKTTFSHNGSQREPSRDSAVSPPLNPHSCIKLSRYPSPFSFRPPFHLSTISISHHQRNPIKYRMSFGGFSDIQRDRDRAHSSRHRNRVEELGDESENNSYGRSDSEERGFSSRGDERASRNEGDGRRGGTYRGEEEGEEQPYRGGGGGGRRPYEEQQPYRGDGDRDHQRTDNYAGGNSEYAENRGHTEGSYGARRNNSEFRENSEGAGQGNTNGGGEINWGTVAGTVAEAGISRFAKAYDKSAEVNKEESGANGRYNGGQPSAFGQRFANGEQGEDTGDIVQKAIGGGAYFDFTILLFQELITDPRAVKAAVEKLTGDRK